MSIKNVTRGSGNVFADLGLEEPEKLQARSELLGEVVAILGRRKLTQVQIAKLLGIDQPRVSALMNGKLSRFSTDKLLEFLSALGNDVEIVVKKRAHTSRPGRIHIVAA